jgi:hypothetical protein
VRQPSSCLTQVGTSLAFDLLHIAHGDDPSAFGCEHQAHVSKRLRPRFWWKRVQNVRADDQIKSAFPRRQVPRKPVRVIPLCRNTECPVILEIAPLPAAEVEQAPGPWAMRDDASRNGLPSSVSRGFPRGRVVRHHLVSAPWIPPGVIVSFTPRHRQTGRLARAAASDRSGTSAKRSSGSPAPRRLPRDFRGSAVSAPR